jgi:hypothetical protein
VDDPAEIILTILAYTRGMYEVEDVIAIYNFILDETDQTSRPELKVVKLERGDD